MKDFEDYLTREILRIFALDATGDKNSTFNGNSNGVNNINHQPNRNGNYNSISFGRSTFKKISSQNGLNAELMLDDDSCDNTESASIDEVYVKTEKIEHESPNDIDSNDTNLDNAASLEEDTHQMNEGDKSPEYFRGKRIFYKSQTTIDKTPKVFRCEDCRFVTKMKFNLARHIKHVHERIRDKPCPYCEYSCGDNGDLKKHIKRRHEIL